MPARQEIDYWLACSVFPGIGPVRFRLLIEYFGSAEKLWYADRAALLKTGLPAKLLDAFIGFRNVHDLQGYRRRLKKEHVSVRTLNDAGYPALLKEIPDAPYVLYVKGHKPRTPIDLTRTIGVVGTRKNTPYGREATERLVTDLVREGCTIVSGLAMGIDAIAHQAALDAGGSTIAVLGCGIDIIAPSVNARLYADIVNGGGAIVSEMPLGHRPAKGLFPARNRIISGLSLGVVVVEGTKESGALITAKNAAEQGREVFAVPGPITSGNSEGPAWLLRDGATLVTSAADILGELKIPARSVKERWQGDTREERAILAALGANPAHIDDLVRQTGLTTREVGATITLLEMKGKVKDFGGKTYGICN